MQLYMAEKKNRNRVYQRLTFTFKKFIKTLILNLNVNYVP